MERTANLYGHHLQPVLLPVTFLVRIPFLQLGFLEKVQVASNYRPLVGETSQLTTLMPMLSDRGSLLFLPDENDDDHHHSVQCIVLTFSSHSFLHMLGHTYTYTSEHTYTYTSEHIYKCTFVSETQ